jgi:cysteine-rich repeat protein
MKLPAGFSLVFAASLLAASPAAAQVCGDYARDPGEQCDDGNARNLDGCNAACQFEQVHRITDLRLQRQTDAAFCPANAFGGAFTILSIGQTNTGINAGVQSGATSILFQFRNLDDLAGTADAAVDVGVLSGAPVLPGSAAYAGNSDLDWWHAADKTLIDAQRIPLNNLAGSFSGGTLDTTPGFARVNLVIGGGPASFAISSLKLQVPVGASSTPASSANALPPGHLAVEHLDPALQSFGTAGVAGTPTGKLCGNVSALSMAQTPIPPSLRVGAGACLSAPSTPKYTTANSLLDVFVGGCNVAVIGTAVNATQPDATDPAAPPAGAGPAYTLSANATTHVVDTCRDNTGTEVDLTTCLTHAAYSVWFRFASNRVIAGDNRVFADSFESGDLSAWSDAQTNLGDLVVDPSAAMAGTTQGLLANVDSTTGLFVEDELPEDENRFRARFYLDPTAFDPGEPVHRRSRVLILLEDGPTRRVGAIVLRRQQGQYGIMGRARLDDGAQADTGFFDITAEPHRVEIDWLRSSGPDANDGRFVLSIDGAVVSTLTGLDNSRSSVDRIRLGGLSLKGTANGPLKMDHYESNRMSATTP